MIAQTCVNYLTLYLSDASRRLTIFHIHVRRLGQSIYEKRSLDSLMLKSNLKMVSINRSIALPALLLRFKMAWPKEPLVEMSIPKLQED